MVNTSFLKNSTFGFLIEELQSGVETVLTQPLQNYSNSITSLEGSFLRLATKAFGFNVIENFLLSGKKFFNALPTITTFESFLDLVQSIFLSREIIVTYLAPAKITIEVNNHNAALLKHYQDKTPKDYIDKQPKNYIGFKEQDFLGLEAFFKKFLQPFLPAGVILESIAIKVNSKGVK